MYSDSDEEGVRLRRLRDKFLRLRDKFLARERAGDYRRDDDRRYDYRNGGAKRVSSTARHTDELKRRRFDAVATSDMVYNDSDDHDDSVMMTFKKFLLKQDDEITANESVARYNEYIAEFKRKSISKFFKAHKNEDWFRIKYHPDDSKKAEEKHFANVQKRLEIFNEFKKKGALDNLTLDVDRAKDIIRLLDSVVVKLEGGTDEDVEALKLEKIVDESIPQESEEDGMSIGVKEEGPLDEGDKGRKKMLLHKTSSIYLRNVPVSVPLAELEEICKRSPGFLRISLNDPIPEKKFYRKGFVTYRRDVKINIKTTCWCLNSISLRGTDFNLKARINRDLTRRIRDAADGITAHTQIAQSDLQIAAKLTAVLDKRIGLFEKETSTKEEREKDIRLGVELVKDSRNPLLMEIRPILKSELSVEVGELLNCGDGAKNVKDEKVVFCRDDKTLRALDKLILYLRIVHSVDFYNADAEVYEQEDTLPNRLGMMHVRKSAPSGDRWGTNDDGASLVSTKFMAAYSEKFKNRIEAAFIHKDYMTDDELEEMGLKDPEEEVEQFIKLNTVQLGAAKWLCPLSGKKFKGPEFIRKHLTLKHEDKLQEVRLEALCFNNYIADAKRMVDVKNPAVSASLPRDDDRRNDERSYGRSSHRDHSRLSPSRCGSGPQRDYCSSRTERLSISVQSPEALSISAQSPEPLSISVPPPVLNPANGNMNALPFELQTMVLERAHCKALHSAQQVNKSWRTYIKSNDEKLRHAMSEDLNLQLFNEIIMRCLHYPHRQFNSSPRDVINALQLTDAEVRRCMIRSIFDLRRSILQWILLVGTPLREYSLHAQSTFEFVFVHIPLLNETRAIYRATRTFLQLDTNLQDMFEVEYKFHFYSKIVRALSPVSNDVMFHYTWNARHLMQSNLPGNEYYACRKALEGIDHGRKLDLSYMLTELRKVFEAVLPLAQAIIRMLNIGIDQFVTDLYDANILNDTIETFVFLSDEVDF